MIDRARLVRPLLILSLLVAMASGCASREGTTPRTTSMPSSSASPPLASAPPPPASAAQSAVPEAKPPGRIARLDVIFQKDVSDVRAEEIIRNLHERGRERLDERKFGAGPVFVVDAPEGRREAIVAEAKKLPEVKDVRSTTNVELVVYFQKGVTEDQATQRLGALGHPFHPGADSSRGKGYFYASGPPFVVNVPVSALDAFTEACSKLPEVKEVYQADKSVLKD